MGPYLLAGYWTAMGSGREDGNGWNSDNRIAFRRRMAVDAGLRDKCNDLRCCMVPNNIMLLRYGCARDFYRRLIEEKSHADYRKTQGYGHPREALQSGLSAACFELSRVTGLEIMQTEQYRISMDSCSNRADLFLGFLKPEQSILYVDFHHGWLLSVVIVFRRFGQL